MEWRQHNAQDAVYVKVVSTEKSNYQREKGVYVGCGGAKIQWRIQSVVVAIARKRVNQTMAEIWGESVGAIYFCDPLSKDVVVGKPRGSTTRNRSMTRPATAKTRETPSITG
jgi:hypothetical protein